MDVQTKTAKERPLRLGLFVFFGTNFISTRERDKPTVGGHRDAQEYAQAGGSG